MQCLPSNARVRSGGHVHWYPISGKYVQLCWQPNFLGQEDCTKRINCVLKHNVVCYGMVCCGMVWYGMVWYGMVWYGMVWYGMVWYGMVWYGMV